MLDAFPTPPLCPEKAHISATAAGMPFAADGSLKEKNAVRKDWLTEPPEFFGGYRLRTS